MRYKLKERCKMTQDDIDKLKEITDPSKPLRLETQGVVTPSQPVEVVVYGECTVPVPDGYYMRYTIGEIEVTKADVLSKLLGLDPYSCRAADLKDVQMLARIALRGADEVTEPI